MDMLDIELEDISEIDMGQFGFDSGDDEDFQPLDLDDISRKNTKIHKCPKCGFEFGEEI